MWMVIWMDYEYTVECFDTYEEAFARYEEINGEYEPFIAKFHEGNHPL
jgi:hypothetical protein